MRDGIGGKARRKQALHRRQNLDPSFDIRPGPLAEMFGQRPEQLKAQHQQNKQNAHQFPGPALSQPALHPGEDHLQQQKIEGGERQQHEERPKQQLRFRKPHAHQNSERPQTAQSGCRVERAIGQPHQKIRAIAERKAQQVGGVRIVREGRRHDREALPEDKHRPQQQRQHLWLAFGDEEKCRPAHESSTTQSAAGERQCDDSSRQQFQLAPSGAQRVREKTPA